MENSHHPQRAAAVRDDAARRVRRITAMSIAGAAALTGIFAAMAAGSTHFAKRTVVHTTKAKAKTATTTQTVTAPAPTLVPNGSSSPAPSNSSSSSSSAPVVTQSSAPPVVVSGGS